MLHRAQQVNFFRRRLPSAINARIEAERRKSYASIDHPLIAAAAGELFRFRGYAQAERRLQAIRRRFVLSRHGDPAGGQSVTLWIRGLGVNEAEAAKGCLGHFAVIGITQLKEDPYTLSLAKLDIDMGLHPSRKREKKAHPD
ncbi:MAG: hypothetical protein JO323_05370 [Acidobacteriia bacterium]|nr:hypothetical protein [Terriglobia bacterium]